MLHGCLRLPLARVVAGSALALGLLVIPVHGQTPRTWTVAVGGASKDSAVVGQAFFPHTLTIRVGDTVHWVFDRQWPVHTVTFLGGAKQPLPEVEEGGKFYINPRVAFPVGGRTYAGTGYQNSGLPPDPAKPFSYTVTFTRPGTFGYLCLLHPGMEGAVVVKASETETAAHAAARGQRELAAVLRAGARAYANWNPATAGSTVTIRLIGNIQEHWSIFRFTRTPLVIARGTTVVWEMRDPQEIHAVTFPGGRAGVANFIVPRPQPQGPPKLQENPDVVTRTPAAHYEEGALASSGIIFPPGVPGNPPTRYRLTFTKAGKFSYVCAVHAPQGMWGTIIVK